MSRASLDPWCLIPTIDGETLLFGFAVWHPETGGLGWLLSTEVLELEADHGRAVTRSGRRYTLGRRFDPVDVGAEGEEPRLAFDLLIADAFEGIEVLREVDRDWLMACKAARHLEVDRPARSQAAVAKFRADYQVAYLQLRWGYRDERS